jgi:hypothetical protein
MCKSVPFISLCQYAKYKKYNSIYILFTDHQHMNKDSGNHLYGLLMSFRYLWQCTSSELQTSRTQHHTVWTGPPSLVQVSYKFYKPSTMFKHVNVAKLASITRSSESEILHTNLNEPFFHPSYIQFLMGGCKGKWCFQKPSDKGQERVKLTQMSSFRHKGRLISKWCKMHIQK